MEKLTKGTLLKAKDGSHYAVFDAYLTKSGTHASYVTPRFDAIRTIFRGGDGAQKSKDIFLVEDYDEASEVEQKLIDEVTKEIRRIRNASGDVCRLKQMWEEVSDFTYLIEKSDKVLTTLDRMIDGIQIVCFLTGKDYIKGDYIGKALKEIKPLAEYIKKELKAKEEFRKDPSNIEHYIDAPF